MDVYDRIKGRGDGEILTNRPRMREGAVSAWYSVAAMDRPDKRKRVRTNKLGEVWY